MNHSSLRLLDATPSTIVLACDVSKADVHGYAELKGKSWRTVMVNSTEGLEEGLRRFKAESASKDIVVVLESTGSYHERLVRVARGLGLETAWVKTEAVAKMRPVVHGDEGKTDRRDPEVIHTLAARIIRHKIRELPVLYRQLREWHRVYEGAEDRMVQTKGILHTVLRRLFPDFDFSVDFLYGRSGKALATTYGANPHRIVADGRATFEAQLRHAVPRIQAKSLKRLWESAVKSVRHADADVADALELRVRQLFEDLTREQQRLLQAGVKLQELYLAARADDPRLPDAQRGVITRLHLARLLAETGPLSDFHSWRALMRYAGYNLREKQSGTYRGKTRISKKGRRLLRKVLNQTVLPLVRKDRLFGPYYHKKRGAGMAGAKAMTTVARKLLKFLWGWYRSGAAFNSERVFTSASQFVPAA